MTVKTAILTLLGAILFPFLVRMLWGEIVKIFGTFGGWISAAVIIGLMWLLNHHLGLMTQSGEIWIDMAFAVAAGIFVATILEGGKVKKSIPVFIGCLIGGGLAGIILAIM